MKECSKAALRRASDSAFVTRYLCGVGLDIGGAPDPLFLHKNLFPRMERVDVWDLPQGDAQFLDGIADDSFDFVHSSHCLEHLINPIEGLKNWFRVVKPGGYLIVSVPDEDLYEQGTFPSTYNQDHKWTFTLFKTRSWNPRSINVMYLIQGLGEAVDVRKLSVLDMGYRYDLPRFDQTQIPGVEAAIEFVVRKRLPEEIAFGGLPIRSGGVSRQGFQLLTGMPAPTPAPPDPAPALKS